MHAKHGQSGLVAAIVAVVIIIVALAIIALLNTTNLWQKDSAVVAPAAPEVVEKTKPVPMQESRHETNKKILQLVPVAPLIVAGNVELGDGIKISNLVNNNTIIAGGVVDITGCAQTVTASGLASDYSNDADDITQEYPKFVAISADEYFETFFNATKADIKQASDISFVNNVGTNYASKLKGVKSKIIWLENKTAEIDINADTVIGSVDAPVIVIINGNVQVEENLTVYGLVYYIGDWVSVGNGTIDIKGSLIIEGNMLATDTPQLSYNIDALTKFIQ